MRGCLSKNTVIHTNTHLLINICTTIPTYSICTVLSYIYIITLSETTFLSSIVASQSTIIALEICILLLDDNSKRRKWHVIL